MKCAAMFLVLVALTAVLVEPLHGQIPIGDRSRLTTTRTVDAPADPCCTVVSYDEARQTLLVEEKLRSAAQLPRRYQVAIRNREDARFRTGQTVYMDGTRRNALTTAFPVKLTRQDDIGRSAWKMKSEATLSTNGRLDVITETRNAEAMRGFTGGVVILVTDKDKNVLHSTRIRTFGVDGTAQPAGSSRRTMQWFEHVPDHAMDKAAGLAIIHSHAPKNRAYRTLEELLEILGITKEIVRELAEIGMIVGSVSSAG